MKLIILLSNLAVIACIRSDTAMGNSSLPRNLSPSTYRSVKGRSGNKKGSSKKNTNEYIYADNSSFKQDRLGRSLQTISSNPQDVHQGMNIYNYEIWGKGKGKGKKKDKGKKKGKGKKHKTSKPSTVPSMAPSISHQPSISTMPSFQPSISTMPSLQPSEKPSSLPSLSPTVYPTLFPSIHPTSLPSTTPSLSPSLTPTTTPSSSPSGTPSIQPTSIPTTQPSLLPSYTPSIHPTDFPSSTPSVSPTSIPTTHPSLLPSYTPSIHPTDFPSSTPSVSPTLIPTTQPSLLPSYTPSIHPTDIPSSTPSVDPTLIPSTQPSLLPSDVPSTHPTDFPSSIPSSSPSSSPSFRPSSKPSRYPSILPSSTPSISSKPSLTPSISPAPSEDTMQVNEAVYDSSGNEIGIKSGCGTPNEIEKSRYAEAVLKELEIKFQYLIRIKDTDENPISDNDLNDVLRSVDYDTQKNIFDDYIQCQGLTSRIRRRTSVTNTEESNWEKRKTQILSNGETYSADEPIGVSSVPPDTQSVDFGCAENIEGQRCVVIDGGVTIYFEEESMYNSQFEEYEVLFHLRDAMDNGELGMGVDNRIIGLVFIQGTNIDFDRGETLVGTLNRSDEEEYLSSSPLISVTGGLIIGSAFFIFIGVITAAFKKRSRSSGFSRDIPDVLEILDREYDGNFDNEENSVFTDLSPHRYVAQDIRFPVAFNETQRNGNKKYVQMMMTEADDEMGCEVFDYSKRKKRRHRSEQEEISPFPVRLTETRNGERFPVNREIINHNSKAQDVHHCTSGTCQICKQNSNNRIKFISSSNDWYEDVEVDFECSSDRVSEKTLDFSRPNLRDRKYNSKNTVRL